MNKNIPILIFASLLLAGCSNAPATSSEASTLPVSTSEVTSQTSQTTSETTSGITSEVTSVEPTSTSEVTSSSAPIETETSTILTSGEVWSAKWSAGTQFDLADGSTKLKTWLNEQVDTEDPLFSELECTKVLSQTSEKGSTTANHLTLGSSNTAGSFTLRSYSVFTGIKLVVSQYYSYNDYSGWNNDANSVLVVNGVDYELPIAESGKSESVEINIPFTELGHFFTLASKNDTKGRVFVDSISVTYMV